MQGATLRQLKAFSVVARHHSFVRAASELCVTPSAVSLQIKELEQLFGLPLFARSGRSSLLTSAGESLLVDVNRALQALEEADDTLNRLRGKETGVVSIGMVSNAKYFLPRLLAVFHATHRGVQMRLSIGNREQLLRQLGNSEVDFAIMGQPPVDLDARAEPFASQPLGILAAPEHPLAGEVRIPPTALAEYDFVVREPGSGTRVAMNRFFRDMQISPPVVMELSSNEAIKQALMGNLGLSFLSLHTAGTELQAKMLVALDVVGLPLVRRWHVVSLQSKPVSEAANSLQRFIVESGGGFIARLFGAFD